MYDYCQYWLIEGAKWTILADFPHLPRVLCVSTVVETRSEMELLDVLAHVRGGGSAVVSMARLPVVVREPDFFYI